MSNKAKEKQDGGIKAPGEQKLTLAQSLGITKTVKRTEQETDIRKRQQLQPKITKIEEDINELKEIQKSWPSAAERIEVLEGQLKRLGERLENLKSERELAAKVGERDRIKKRLDNIEATEDELEKRHVELNGLKKISKEDLEFLEAESLQLRELEMVLGASGLRGKLISSPKGADIYVSEGFEDERKTAEGDEFSAKGMLTIRSSDGLEIRISAGDHNLEESAARARELKEGIENRLKDIQVGSLQEARRERESHTLVQEAINRLDERLQILLGEESREDLEKILEGLGDLEGLRVLAEIEEEMDGINGEILGKRVDQKSIEDKLDSWKERYGTQDNLMDLIIGRSEESPRGIQGSR